MHLLIVKRRGVPGRGSAGTCTWSSKFRRPQAGASVSDHIDVPLERRRDEPDPDRRRFRARARSRAPPRGSPRPAPRGHARRDLRPAGALQSPVLLHADIDHGLLRPDRPPAHAHASGGARRGQPRDPRGAGAGRARGRAGAHVAGGRRRRHQPHHLRALALRTRPHHRGVRRRIRSGHPVPGRRRPRGRRRGAARPGPRRPRARHPGTPAPGPRVRAGGGVRGERRRDRARAGDRSRSACSSPPSAV